MMEKWKEFATPNENHKVLDTLVGSWDHTVKWWMSPGGNPEESKGTSEIKWIMGGRYLQQLVQGTSMGQPFEGMGITGYDNAKKEYNSIWIDNMGTGIMMTTGNYDPNTKTLTELGKYTDPIEGQKVIRGVTKSLTKTNILMKRIWLAATEKNSGHWKSYTQERSNLSPIDFYEDIYG